MRLRLGLVIAALAASCLFGAASAETITIGAEDDWYPYGGAIDGQPAGLGVDLVSAAFNAVGVNVRFTSLPYARCLEMVKRGELLACNEPARTEETESSILWPDEPLFVAQSLIYARAGSKESGLSAASLEGKSVAVTNGFEYGSSFDANKKILREVVVKEISVFRMLAAQRVEYALAYQKVANWIIANNAKEFAGKLTVVGKIDELGCYTGFSRTFPNSARYLKLFNQGFAKIKKNGTYAEIEKRYP
ncbi:MAG: transporter substrate-binding domain-containing protein [Rhodocyclaceae bacterium]|nr:transporter substrate-binding domain-containing protein [Rhodocyclaceae bacterium]